ncbi:MAG: alpha/beta hydrolase [Gammaproteobacteria bacterium]|nr:alpha/beta hydrolase [Gammaproteobacteria bacterium]
MLNVNKSQFYYELHGKGDPLVLISGLIADHTGWLPVLDNLSRHYSVLIFDNRGTGRTIDDESSFKVENMADDVMQIVQRLNLNKPHIVGHSLGGAVAQTMATKYSEHIRSIALCNTFIKFNEIGKKAFTNILQLYQANESSNRIINNIIPWVFSAKFLNPEIIDLIQKAAAENQYPQSLSGYERQLKALCEFDSSKWIHLVNAPTLVIGSDDDKVATLAESAELAKAIAGAKFKTLSTGHASPVEEPELFVEALKGFYRH